MREERYELEVNDWERRFLAGYLIEARTELLEQDKPIEDICGILEKTVRIQPETTKRKSGHEAR